MRMRGAFLAAFLLVGAVLIRGAQKLPFTAGDQTILEDDFSRCPVGEIPEGWEILSGAVECARMESQIWVLPLQHVTRLQRILDFPEEWSLELQVYGWGPQGPFLDVQLYEVRDGRVEGDYRTGVLLRADQGSKKILLWASVWEKGKPRNEFIRERRIAPTEQAFWLQIQYRRKQFRVFVDGKLISRVPASLPTGRMALQLRFGHTSAGPTPLSEAAMLLGGIRLAGYSAPETPPEPESVLLQKLGAQEVEGGWKVVLQETVLFDVGKWDLKPEARETLDRLAQLILMEGARVRVEGHTDSTGSAEYNLLLSYLRAYAVAWALAQRGVPLRRLEARGFGEERPIASNDTPEGRAKNRRVEIWILRES